MWAWECATRAYKACWPTKCLLYDCAQANTRGQISQPRNMSTFAHKSGRSSFTSTPMARMVRKLRSHISSRTELYYECIAKRIKPRGLLEPHLRIFHQYYISLTHANIAVASLVVWWVLQCTRIPPSTLILSLKGSLGPESYLVTQLPFFLNLSLHYPPSLLFTAYARPFAAYVRLFTVHSGKSFYFNR